MMKSLMTPPNFEYSARSESIVALPFPGASSAKITAILVQALNDGGGPESPVPPASTLSPASASDVPASFTPASFWGTTVPGGANEPPSA